MYFTKEVKVKVNDKTYYVDVDCDGVYEHGKFYVEIDDVVIDDGQDLILEDHPDYEAIMDEVQKLDLFPDME